MSTRTQIADAITTRLKAQVASVSSRVFRWRKAALSESELPALIWRDGKGDISEDTIGMWRHDLGVTLCYAASGSTTASAATTALTEMAAAIMTDYTLGGLAESIECINSDLMVGQEGEILGAAQIEIIITYNSPRGTI